MEIIETKWSLSRQNGDYRDKMEIIETKFSKITISIFHGQFCLDSGQSLKDRDFPPLGHIIQSTCLHLLSLYRHFEMK